MQHTAPSPWVTAGVALVGAGAIAVTPTAVPMPAVSPLQLPSVVLTAGWVDVWDNAAADVTALGHHAVDAPLPVLQQELANQIGYLRGLLDGSLSFDDIAKDIQGHLTALFGAPATENAAAIPGALFGPFELDSDTDTVYASPDDTVASTGTGLLETITFTHSQLWTVLDGALPNLLGSLGLDDSQLPMVQSLFAFAGSPLSGILLGELGTVLSPALQFDDDITAISNALTGDTPDWDTALQTLARMPADITGAYLNGYGEVDLVPILDQLGISLPPLEIIGGAPADVTGLDLNLGGLLSGGTSIFDSIGVGADMGPTLGTMDLSALAVGPIAAMIALGQSIAGALGWDGSGDILTGLF